MIWAGRHYSERLGSISKSHSINGVIDLLGEISGLCVCTHVQAEIFELHKGQNCKKQHIGEC